MAASMVHGNKLHASMVHGNKLHASMVHGNKLHSLTGGTSTTEAQQGRFSIWV